MSDRLVRRTDDVFNRDCTIVTALLDLGREHWKPPYHRAWTYYLKHFRKTLSLRCKMAVFVEPKLVDFVVAVRRKRDPTLQYTRIYVQDIDGLPRYRYIHRISAVLGSPAYRTRVCNPIRPETYNPVYNVVIHSKTALVRRVCESNPLGTPFFLWMDAGLGREQFPNRMRDAYYPDDAKVAAFADGKVRLVCRSMPQPSDLDLGAFFLRSINRIAAGWWGGTAQGLIRFDDECATVLQQALDRGVIDNEQSVFAVSYLRLPDAFALHHGGWYSGLIDYQSDRLMPCLEGAAT